MADKNTGFVVALQMYVLHNWCAYGPTVACGGLDPRPGMKGKRLLGTPCWYSERVSYVYLARLNSIQNHPPLTRIETAYRFCHIE
jgi:hypothetical protein